MDPRKPIEWMHPSRANRPPNWRLRFVEDAGHQLFMENPLRFNQICADFINGKVN
jgi:pimeloyl-ACP methyl ester carboxylesterase